MEHLHPLVKLSAVELELPRGKDGGDGHVTVLAVGRSPGLPILEAERGRGEAAVAEAAAWAVGRQQPMQQPSRRQRRGRMRWHAAGPSTHTCPPTTGRPRTAHMCTAQGPTRAAGEGAGWWRVRRRPGARASAAKFCAQAGSLSHACTRNDSARPHVARTINQQERRLGDPAAVMFV